DVGPMDVFGVGTGGDAEGTGRAVGRQEGSEALVDVGVVLGRHVAAAPPALVTHAPEAHAPRCVTAVPVPQGFHPARAIEIHVLPPLGHLERGAAPDVANDEPRGPEAIGRLEIPVRPEAVVTGRVATPCVDARGAL